MFSSLDHAVIGVRDLEAATSAYSALLGREPWWRGTHPGAGTANALYDLAGVGIELLTPQGEGPVGRALAAGLEGRGEGLVALAFGTGDADACAQGLRARGLEAGAPRPGSGVDPGGATRHWRSVEIPLSATRGLLLFGIERGDGPAPPSEQSQPRKRPQRSKAARSEASQRKRSDGWAPGAVGGARCTGSSEPSVVTGLDHVVVTSPDLEGARSLYGDLLGLRLALERRFEARRLHILFFRVGGVTVELVGRLDAAAEASGSDAFGGLAYRVGDADAARARVAAAGFDVSEVRPGAKPGTRVCTVRDGTCGVPTLLLGG